MNNEPYIDSWRLFEAADALLKAIESKEGVQVLIPGRGDPPMSTGSNSSAFTHAELVEAMTLLIRMGFVTPGKKATSTK